MPGLRWTSRGAVALPETLQIRLAPSFAGRVQAGAPLPGRALTLPVKLAERPPREAAVPTPEERPLPSSLRGGTRTFRSGQQSGWKEAFSEANRRAFERQFGDVLALYGYQ